MDCAGDVIDEIVLSGIDGADSGYETLDPVDDAWEVIDSVSWVAQARSVSGIDDVSSAGSEDSGGASDADGTVFKAAQCPIYSSSNVTSSDDTCSCGTSVDL